MAISPSKNISFFKRYRMELDLLEAVCDAPALPIGFSWLPWNEDLLDLHAEVTFACFREEIDGVVFPNLNSPEGCKLLMQEIRRRNGFRPEATWILLHGEEPIGTVQGVSDRYGVGSIQNLGILHEYRGRGLGSLLLRQTLFGFRSYGLVRTDLEVTEQNEAAVKLYRQHGFRFRRTIYKLVESQVPNDATMPEWCL